MKELFKYLRTKLMQVPGTNWVDLDKGQINNYEVRPAIAFPAALIKIDFPRIENLGSAKQKYTTRINIKLAFDYTGVTDNTADEDLLNDSLAFFDVVEAAKTALKDAIDLTVMNKPLELVSMIEESRRDELKVMNLVFSTVVFG